MNEAVEVIPHPLPNDKRFINLTGETYSRLTVVGYAGKMHMNSHMWWCRCVCGNLKKTYGAHIKRGLIQSCGCLNSESRRKTRFQKHGLSRSAEYYAHKEMIQRCYRRTHISWKNYGGRGITVCNRWRFGENGKTGFECFIEDMGMKPTKSHSLDREDNNGNYCKGNCAWSTSLDQHNNTRSNVKLEWKGETLTIAQWARRVGLKDSTLRERLKRNANDLEKALEPTTRKYAKNTKHTHHASAKVSLQTA